MNYSTITTTVPVTATTNSTDINTPTPNTTTVNSHNKNSQLNLNPKQSIKESNTDIISIHKKRGRKKKEAVDMEAQAAIAATKLARKRTAYSVFAHQERVFLEGLKIENMQKGLGKFLSYRWKGMDANEKLLYESIAADSSQITKTTKSNKTNTKMINITNIAGNGKVKDESKNRDDYNSNHLVKMCTTTHYV